MTALSVLSPLEMRNLTVKNRVMRSSIGGRVDNEDGSLTQTRLNWEAMFAEGGIGAIISAHVPVLMSGRIMAGYAPLPPGSSLPSWAKDVPTPPPHDFKYINHP